MMTRVTPRSRSRSARPVPSNPEYASTAGSSPLLMMTSAMLASQRSIGQFREIGLNRSEDHAGRSGTMREIATRPSRQALRHEARALGKLVTRTASADVKGEACGPHNLRHTYALRGLLTAANVVQVCKLLGHSSITTTSA